MASIQKIQRDLEDSISNPLVVRSASCVDYPILLGIVYTAQKMKDSNKDFLIKYKKSTASWTTLFLFNVTS